MVDLDEVKPALWKIDSNSPLGLDGFNAHFFKKAWPKIGFSIWEVVRNFSRIIHTHSKKTKPNSCHFDP